MEVDRSRADMRCPRVPEISAEHLQDKEELKGQV